MRRTPDGSRRLLIRSFQLPLVFRPPRTIRTAPAGQTLFPGARQVFRLRRDTGGLDGDWTAKEIILGVTSLPTPLAGPEHLNYHERQHWTVENRLHWVRDVTFREDNSQLRTGTAPRALASFRNLAINAFRLDRRTNIAHARRRRKNPLATRPGTQQGSREL